MFSFFVKKASCWSRTSDTLRPGWLKKQIFEAIPRRCSFSSILLSLIRPKSESFHSPEVFWKVPSWTIFHTEIKRPRSPQESSFRNCSSSHWKPAVNRQPGYRWGGSKSHIHFFCFLFMMYKNDHFWLFFHYFWNLHNKLKSSSLLSKISMVESSSKSFEWKFMIFNFSFFCQKMS